jgi:methylmalonyl-CoA mutase N-terminal domain/subunit
VTVQTLAAVLGGTQSLHTNGYDEALSLPTESAARIALRTQQIVAFESGVADTADPLAGSFYVEALTHEVEQKTRELMQRLDEMGGSVAAIESGFMQDEIARSAYHYQQGIERGEKIIVGVNKFGIPTEDPIPPFKIDDNIRLGQIEKLRMLKEQRDNNAVLNYLETIRQHAVTGNNLMPAVIDAVEHHCTLGEIADVLRGVFGEFR